MIIGYARVSTTEQNLGLRHDDVKPAFDASVDQTNGTSLRRNHLLLKNLRLMPDGLVKIHVDMCRSILRYETSEFRLIETVFINIIQHPFTPKFDVKPYDIEAFA
jgi:hypothetical protein